MKAVVLLTLAFLVHASAGLSVANACGGDGGSVEYWTRMLRAPDRDDRLRAARNPGENRAGASIPALVGALRDEDLEVRVTAIQALGRLGERAKTAVPALEQALTDATPSVRTETAKALERIRTR